MPLALYGLRRTGEAPAEADAIQHPGVVRLGPRREQLIRQRLPAFPLLGTRLALVGMHHARAPAGPESANGNGALLLWDYTMFDVVALHCMLIPTVGLGCASSG